MRAVLVSLLCVLACSCRSQGSAQQPAPPPVTALRPARPAPLDLNRAVEQLCTPPHGSPIACEVGDTSCEGIQRAFERIRHNSCGWCGTPRARAAAALRKAEPEAGVHVAKGLDDIDWVVVRAAFEALRDRSELRLLESWCGQAKAAPHQGLLCEEFRVRTGTGVKVSTESLLTVLGGQDGHAALQALRFLHSRGERERVWQWCETDRGPLSAALCYLSRRMD